MQKKYKPSREFNKGWKDCEKGIPHKPNKPTEYTRGYSASECSIKLVGKSYE